MRDHLSASDMEEAFAWNPASFALEAGDVDKAWHLLSDCAEDVLCDQSSAAIPCARH